MSALLLAGSAAASGNVPSPVPDGTATTEQPAATTTEGTVTEPVPVPPEPVAPVDQTVPAILPAPGLAVQALLLKQDRKKLVRYRKSAWHWQNLLGLKRSPGGNIWSLGDLQTANQRLSRWQSRSRRLHAAAKKYMRRQIGFYRRQVAHMDIVMGVRRGRALQSTGNLEERFVKGRRHWQAVYRRYQHPPYESQLSCIHYNPRLGHGEGAWNANTGNSFYGGLQMNMGFMRDYGSYLLRTKGTADNWTPLEQMWTAAKAVRSGRGFAPWPNTARYCGLL